MASPASVPKPLTIDETLKHVTKFTEKLAAGDAATQTILSKYHVFLDALKNTPACDSPFVRCTVPIAVQLYPHQLADVEAAVNQYVNSCLLTCYASQALEGILLMYRHIVIPPKNQIQFNSPVLIVRIHVDCIFFTPKVDSFLVACVSQRGYDFVGLLLFGIFNVSITTENIRQALLPKLKVQTFARFQVKANFFNCNPPIIEGSMLKEHCKVMKE